jgi:hypothetical protein
MIDAFNGRRGAATIYRYNATKAIRPGAGSAAGAINCCISGAHPL